jgi:diguanylate cyclase (GGDEF)-like protein
VKLVAGVRAGGTTVIDEQQCLASGEIRTVEIHSTPMRLGDRVLDLAIVHDVTEQRRAVERLERLASTDDLTGAYNRRRFLALVADEIERCERYEREMSLLMLDLDHFKSINDSFGHLAGDATLVAFSDECSNHLRANDRFARMGGEEFAILMPEAGIADAAALGERLRLAVEQLVVPDVDGAPHTTVSIGGAQWEHGWSTDELFARADRMLYRAKQAGRNRFEG